MLDSASSDPIPFDQGSRARYSGRSLVQNPYRPDAWEYNDWIEGWKHAAAMLDGVEQKPIRAAIVRVVAWLEIVRFESLLSKLQNDTLSAIKFVGGIALLLVLFTPNATIKGLMPIYSAFGKNIEVADVPFLKIPVQLMLDQVIPSATTLDQVFQMLELSLSATLFAPLLVTPICLAIVSVLRITGSITWRVEGAVSSDPQNHR